jgi:hypothetical protein
MLGLLPGLLPGLMLCLLPGLLLDPLGELARLG